MQPILGMLGPKGCDLSGGFLSPVHLSKGSDLKMGIDLGVISDIGQDQALE